MNDIVTAKEYTTVVRIVSDNSLIKISDTVKSVTNLLEVTPARARYIVRAAIDRGIIMTDSKFNLYVQLES